MPAYNHTAMMLVERTRDHVTLNQEGDFHCQKCGLGMTQPNYIGGSTMDVQRHFEEEHGFVFHERPSGFAGHRAAEGI